MPRPYRVPWSPVLPILGVLFAIYLMSDLPLSTWIRFVVWLGLGLAIYFLYGYKHSKLRTSGTSGTGGDGTPSWARDTTPDTPPPGDQR
jgi:APA family basic amino acid/polyamine antiporter